MLHLIASNCLVLSQKLKSPFNDFRDAPNTYAHSTHGDSLNQRTRGRENICVFHL